MKYIYWIAALVSILGGSSVFLGIFDQPLRLEGVAILVAGLTFILFANKVLKQNIFSVISAVCILVIGLTIPLLYIVPSENILAGYILGTFWIMVGGLCILSLFIGLIRSLFVK